MKKFTFPLPAFILAAGLLFSLGCQPNGDENSTDAIPADSVEATDSTIDTRYPSDSLAPVN